MIQIWKEATKEVLDALAHTAAVWLGEPIRETFSYRQYRWRGKLYTIEKD